MLQVLDVEASGPLRLTYDLEWLAILRSTYQFMSLERRSVFLPTMNDRGVRYDYRPTPEELADVRARFDSQRAGDLCVPGNFSITAPVYDEAAGPRADRQPEYATNPQTTELLALLGLPDIMGVKFDAQMRSQAARSAGVQHQQQPLSSSSSSSSASASASASGGGLRGDLNDGAAAAAAAAEMQRRAERLSEFFQQYTEEIDISAADAGSDSSGDEDAGDEGAGSPAAAAAAAAAAASPAHKKAGLQAHNDEEIDLDSEPAADFATSPQNPEEICLN